MIKRTYFFRALKTTKNEDGERKVYCGTFSIKSFFVVDGERVFQEVRRHIRTKEGSDVEIETFNRI